MSRIGNKVINLPEGVKIDVNGSTVTVTGKGNYSGTITKTYTITPAPVTAPEIAGFEYNGSNQVPTLSDDFTGEGGNYKDAVVSITNAGGTNAGTYSVVIKIDGNHKWVDKYGKDLTTSGNYTLSEDGKTLTVSYEITPIGIEVSVTNNEIIMNEPGNNGSNLFATYGLSEVDRMVVSKKSD